MKLKTTAVMLLAMTATMPALADNHASVKGEAQVEAETGFFSRAMGGIRNIFGGGEEAARENQGKSEAAHENAAESKAEGQAKAEAAREKTKEKSKDNMKAAKDKAAKDKSRMQEKAADKAESGQSKADEKAAKADDKAEEAEAGKGLGVDAKIGVKLGN